VEKGSSHCKLPAVKALVQAGRVRATASAFTGARDLGINDLAGMCAIVLALNSDDFYKSMTTHVDHRIWQGVYRGITADGVEVYLKRTVIDDLLTVSFKKQ
jgi:motility quorum-sensing regulator/GCU-specific mRNA interferase toxin